MATQVVVEPAPPPKPAKTGKDKGKDNPPDANGKPAKDEAAKAADAKKDSAK